MSTAYSIKRRLNLIFLVTVIGLLAAMAALSLYLGRQEREAALHHELESIVARLSGSLPAPLWNFDQGQLDRIVAAEMGAPFIDAIVVEQDHKVAGGMARGEADQPIALKEPPPASEESRQAVLSYNDNGVNKALGTVTVHYSYRGVRHAMQRDLLLQSLQAVVLAAVLIAALSISLSRVVLRPLDAVHTALEGIGAGSADLTRRLPTAGSTEFIGIAQGFNAFVARLESVIHNVRSQTESVATGSKEIAEGNLDLAERTEQTASHLQSITQTVSEIHGSVAVNSEGAEMADRCGREAAMVAEHGGSLMNEVVATMQEMTLSAGRITDITGVIQSIAFQTNLLALNAAVEAARAGEQGRGFAVVAAEVRSLAHRAADAAKEIKVLIDDTVTQVGNGQQQVSAAGDAIKNIVVSIRKVNDILQGITAATQQQRTAIGQVSEAIADIDEATQRNAALVEQVSAAASSVRESTAELVVVVGEFTVGSPMHRLPITLSGHSGA